VTAAQRLAELRDSIRLADDQYYNRGHSDLTDTEYDILFVELRKLEAAHQNSLPRIRRPSGWARH
jgi:NAD-dependent DNA ligase